MEQPSDQSATCNRSLQVRKADLESVSAVPNAEKKKRSRKRSSKSRQTMLEYSKRITNDMRGLLWAISVGGLLLGFYAVHARFEGALPWISAMVGLPWTAWGTAAAFYMNLAKSDHKTGGITHDTAMAEIAASAADASGNSPPI